MAKTETIQKHSDDYMTGIERYNRVAPVTNVVFNIVFVIFSLLCVIPVLLVVSISFSSEQSINEFGYRLIPKIFTLEAYQFLWTSKETILGALGVSVFVTLVGTVIGVLLTTTMGYVLSRRDYKMHDALTWLVFIPMVFNGGMISTFFINSNLLNLKDTVWALILPLCVSSFNVIVARTFFSTTIPDSLVESAQIDGASQLLIYFRIVLPISLPILATIALFLSFAYWNDWFQSMLYITDHKLYSLQALLNQIMSSIEYLSRNAAKLGMSAAQLSKIMPKESSRMAIAVVIVVPIAATYPFLQKYFISGLTVGAVKG